MEKNISLQTISKKKYTFSYLACYYVLLFNNLYFFNNDFKNWWLKILTVN